MRLPGLLLLLPLLALPVEAQPRAGAPADEHGFRFIRIRYDSHGRSWSEPWSFDYPAAERNLHTAIERTTGLHLEGEPAVLSLADEEIFAFPILYLCEPGYWRTNDEEVANLQRYFARGGFMIIDDFHDYGRGETGPEWDNFYANFRRVFPDRELVELTPDHPIWSIYYDIDPVSALSTKIQGRETPFFDADDDMYFGVYDDAGRLMMVVCYNQDIGDGWEWPNRNLGEASTVSFQMAINFIIYALSH